MDGEVVGRGAGVFHDARVVNAGYGTLSCIEPRLNAAIQTDRAVLMRTYPSVPLNATALRTDCLDHELVLDDELTVERGMRGYS